jgi:ATP-dependent DNA helicase RecQ
VPAFVVMHDTSLEELCRMQPRSLSELRRVPGFGERKTASYGGEILAALGRFSAGARAPEATAQISSPARETARLLAEGRTFEEIAKIRGRQVSTIINLAAGLIEKQQLRFQPAWIESARLEKIRTACVKHGLDRLRPLKDALPKETTYDEIRLVVAHLRSQGGRPSTNAPAS